MHPASARDLAHRQRARFLLLKQLSFCLDSSFSFLPGFSNSFLHRQVRVLLNHWSQDRRHPSPLPNCIPQFRHLEGRQLFERHLVTQRSMVMPPIRLLLALQSLPCPFFSFYASMILALGSFSFMASFQTSPANRVLLLPAHLYWYLAELCQLAMPYQNQGHTRLDRPSFNFPDMIYL